MATKPKEKTGGELILAQLGQVNTVGGQLANLTELFQTYKDEQIAAVIEQGKIAGYVGMRCSIAAEYEGHRRVINRVKTENESLPPDKKLKAEPHLEELAAQWGIEKRTLDADQRIHRVFFVARPFDGPEDATEEARKEFAENEKASLFETEQAADYLGSKQYLTIALRGDRQGMARECLIELARFKEANGGSLTTRGAEDHIREFLGINGSRTKPEAEAPVNEEVPSTTADVMGLITSLKQAEKMVMDSREPAYVFRLDNDQWVASINEPADELRERMMVVPVKNGCRVLHNGEDYDEPEEDDEEGGGDDTGTEEDAPAIVDTPVSVSDPIDDVPEVEPVDDTEGSQVPVFDED